MGNAGSAESEYDEETLRKIRGVIVMQKNEPNKEEIIDIKDGVQLTVPCNDEFEPVSVPLTLPAMWADQTTDRIYNRLEPPTLRGAYQGGNLKIVESIHSMDEDEVSYIHNLPSLHPLEISKEKRERLLSQKTTEDRDSAKRSDAGISDEIKEREKAAEFREQQDLLTILNNY